MFGDSMMCVDDSMLAGLSAIFVPSSLFHQTDIPQPVGHGILIRAKSLLTDSGNETECEQHDVQDAMSKEELRSCQHKHKFSNCLKKGSTVLPCEKGMCPLLCMATHPSRRGRVQWPQALLECQIPCSGMFESSLSGDCIFCTC